MPAVFSKSDSPTLSPYMPSSFDHLDYLQTSILNYLKQLLQHFKSNGKVYKILTLALIFSGVVGSYYIRKRNQPSRKRSISSEHQIANPKQSKPSTRKEMKEKHNVLLDFGTNMYNLLRIGFKTPINDENNKSLRYLKGRNKFIGLMVLVSSLVVLKSIVVCRSNFISGDMMEYLLSKNREAFFESFSQFLISISLQSLITPTLSYMIELLSLHLRKNLTMNLHEKYFSDLCYYKINNLDRRLGAVDQRITQDIDVLSTRISELFADILHPSVDLIIYTHELVRLMGWSGFVTVLVYFMFAVGILSRVSPNFTKFTSQAQNMEGHFRQLHNRCAIHSEQISFYRGDDTERAKVEDYFEQLTSYSNFVIKKNFSFGMVNDFLTKYFPHSYSSFIIGFSIFFGRLKHLKGQGDVLLGKLRYLAAIVALEFYALGDLIELFRKILRLSGLAHRVSLLFQIVEEIKSGNSPNINFRKNHKGEMLDSDEIKFSNVTIKTPDEITLARNLTFHVSKKEHIVISGSNGAGKSSLFRVLGSLWPLHEGSIHKPQACGNNASGLHKEIFYLPQKPYNIVGSLRGQIIYPEKENKSGWNDGMIEDLLHDFGISYLVTRSEEGFETVQDWNNLSRGEQQKLALVRLFYHKPKYAILDECTSCITADDEEKLYRMCTKMEITCITISHRPALEKYHTQRLVFDGTGGWIWQEIVKPYDIRTDEEPVYKLKGFDKFVRDDMI